MDTKSVRGVYARRGLETLKQGESGRDVSHRLSSQIDRAIDQWILDTGKPKRAKRPEPRHWHRQHQAPIKKSLAQLLAEADAPKPEPLDTTGFELWIVDGDRPGKLALE